MINDIKQFRDEDFGPFTDIWKNAYPGFLPPNFSRDSKIEEFKNSSQNPKIKFYGFFKDKILIGGLILYDFHMNLFNDNIINCGGIGEVCVDLLYKKEHVARDLMAFSHKYFLEKGFTLTCLYPFSPAFYKQMGYGLGNKMSQYRFEPKTLTRTSKKNVSYLSLSDLKVITDCFNRYASTTHGMILRSKEKFDPMLKTGRLIGVWDDLKKELNGYLYFRFVKLEGGSRLQYNIEILEMIYETQEALKELLTFLSCQQDQITYIIYNTYDAFFHHLLKEPRSRKESMFHIFQESNIQGVGMMYRIIDVKKFFNLLKDHRFSKINHQSLIIKFKINDSFLSENNQTITVNLHEGKIQVLEGEDRADSKINIDINDFSSLMMGTINFEQLYKYGLVNITNKNLVNEISEFFITNTLPVTFEPF